MLRNYFVIAIRTLIKNPLFSFIKIAGLTVGVCGCLVIFLVARYELSFDKFQPDGDRIYRIYSEFSGVFKGFNRGVPNALPPTVQKEFTGLEAVSPIQTYATKVEVKNGQEVSKKFDLEQDLLIASPEYFTVFNHYQWLAGTADNLKEPFSVVLTASKAKKYFGLEQPQEAMGKQLVYNDSLEITVVGVLKDVDENSDFSFGDFISFSTIEKTWLKENYQPEDWGSTNSSSQVFIKLSKGTSPSKIEEQMPLLMQRYMESQKEPDPSWIVTYKLQPLSEIHYNLDIGIFDNGHTPANLSTLRTLMIAAFLLLVIAAINFINLETAQAVKRSKEVGLRKTMGGTQSGLVKHFLLESTLLATIAVLIALPLAELSLKFFEEFLPEGVSLNLLDPWTVSFLVIIISSVVLLSGLYPAFVLSSFQPAQALKNQVAKGKNSGSALLRKILTVFQFSFSQALIIGTLIVSWQIKFMIDKDMGFDKEAIITFNTPWWIKDNRPDVLLNELNQLPEIKAISRNSSAPARSGATTSTLTLLDNGNERPLNVHSRSGDTTYLSLFRIPLVAGRILQPSDSALEFMVNEAYCREMGYEPIDMIGKEIKSGGKRNYTIVGVMQDFHFQSMHHKIEPLHYRYSGNQNGYSIKLKNEGVNSSISESVEKIKSAWNKIYPDAEFDPSFLDERIKNFYESEKRVSKLTDTATILTIFISCLGLLGLAAFNASQRTKEIGIRKVLGATVTSIVSLLSREFIAMVFIAFVVAAPLAWYGGNYWLNEYAFRITLGWEIFVIAGALSVIVAFLTVGFQTLSAALANPVESLRYE